LSEDSDIDAVVASGGWLIVDTVSAVVVVFDVGGGGATAITLDVDLVLVATFGNLVSILVARSDGATGRVDGVG